MRTFKPTTDVRVQAIEFIELTPEFSKAYPIRYVIEDDAFNRGHYELWVEKSRVWEQIIPGEWVVLEADGIGFYSCPAVEF